MACSTDLIRRIARTKVGGWVLFQARYRESGDQVYSPIIITTTIITIITIITTTTITTTPPSSSPHRHHHPNLGIGFTEVPGGKMKAYVPEVNTAKLPYPLIATSLDDIPMSCLSFKGQ